MICNVQFKKEENQAKLYFYFGVMNSWLKEKVPADNILDKTIDKINN